MYYVARPALRQPRFRVIIGLWLSNSDCPIKALWVLSPLLIRIERRSSIATRWGCLSYPRKCRLLSFFDAHGTMLRVTIVKEVIPAGYTVLGWQVPNIVAAAEAL